MNEYQQKLYDDLMALTSSATDVFYFKDFRRGVTVYRIFNYRLANYTSFLAPSAMECRGIMFEVESEAHNAKAVRLVSHPMEKFFNLNENPLTMNLDLNDVVEVELKVDGSLISTYLHFTDDDARIPMLGLKTKGSIDSEQSVAALAWLRRDENRKLRHELMNLTESGYTVNMEWCAPDNRVVIGYLQPSLRVLNVRSNETGEYLHRDQVSALVYPELVEAWVTRTLIGDPRQFVSEIPRMTDVEGFVILLKSGMRIKVKTEWYLTQHRAKDSINSPRRLFEAVLEEATDDLRSMFFYDALIVARIDEMEKFASGLYNHTFQAVESFYDENKQLERKDYAIKGQQVLDKRIFGLAMNKYLGKPVDYKMFLRKHYKEFGIKDEEIQQDE